MSILITVLNVIFYTSLLIAQDHMRMLQERVNQIALNDNPDLHPILMGLNLDGQQDDPALERFVLKIQLMEIQKQRNALHEQMPQHIKDLIEKHNQQFTEIEQARREQPGNEISEFIRQKDQLITEKENLEEDGFLKIREAENSLKHRYEVRLNNELNKLKRTNQDKMLKAQITRINKRKPAFSLKTREQTINDHITRQLRLRFQREKNTQEEKQKTTQLIKQIKERTIKTLELLDNQINLLSRKIEEKHKIQKPSELQFIQQELNILKDYAEHNNNNELEPLIRLTEKYIPLLQKENNN